jgi:hypothetical protein
MEWSIIRLPKRSHMWILYSNSAQIWHEFGGPNWKHGCSSLKCLTNTRHAVCLASKATMRIIHAYIAHYIALRHKIWRLLVSSHVNRNFYICTIRNLNINIPSWLTSSEQPCQNPFRSQSCSQLRHSQTLRAGEDINHSVSFNGVNCTNIEYQESVSTLKYPRNHVDRNTK